MVLVLFLVLGNIGCDQGTKDFARKNIRGKGTISVAGNFFILKYAENDGAFLGMGSKMKEPFKTVLLVVLPLLLIAGALVYLILDKKIPLTHAVSVSFILGGGISNLADRILNQGLVTDFMNFGIGALRTGILNFADLSITFGVLFLVIFEYLKKERPNKNGSPQVKKKARPSRA